MSAVVIGPRPARQRLVGLSDPAATGFGSWGEARAFAAAHGFDSEWIQQVTYGVGARTVWYVGVPAGGRLLLVSVVSA